MKADNPPTINMYYDGCYEHPACIGKQIQERIFSECRANQTESPTEEWFDDMVDRIHHEEMDDFITRKVSDEESEALVAKYGISKAIKEYKEEFGEIHMREDLNVCKTLLYNIIEMNYLSLSYHSYKQYCVLYGLDGFEGEEGLTGEVEPSEDHKEEDRTMIRQKDTENTLFWGATDGFLTIWRVPSDLEFDTDTYGNKRCLGEEWGMLTVATMRTITQKMLDDEDFE